MKKIEEIKIILIEKREQTKRAKWFKAAYKCLERRDALIKSKEEIKRRKWMSNIKIWGWDKKANNVTFYKIRGHILF